MRFPVYTLVSIGLYISRFVTLIVAITSVFMLIVFIQMYYEVLTRWILWVRTGVCQSGKYVQQWLPVVNLSLLYEYFSAFANAYNYWKEPTELVTYSTALMGYLGYTIRTYWKPYVGDLADEDLSYELVWLCVGLPFITWVNIDFWPVGEWLFNHLPTGVQAAEVSVPDIAQGPRIFREAKPFDFHDPEHRAIAFSLIALTAYGTGYLIYTGLRYIL